MSQKRLAAVLGVLVVGIVVFSFMRGTFAGGATPAAAMLSDSAIQAVMAANIDRFANPAVHRNADGSPDIAVSSGVLFVTTLAPDTAASLCRSVAAMTNDPDTAKPLGISGVIIISGGHSVATCTP